MFLLLLCVIPFLTDSNSSTSMNTLCFEYVILYLHSSSSFLSYIYIRPLNTVENKCDAFCMNRMTFRDLSVGGVLVKTCIIVLR